MDGQTDRQLVRGFWATSLGTLASRVLGLVRDIVTASLLGLGQGGVMDALVVALRVPNLARRTLGEGALATSLLPVLSAQHERRPADAWRLVSLLLVLLTLGLTAVVLVGEAICFAWWRASPDGSPLAGLTAVLLPYMVLVCLAAQLAATLQGLLRFRVPALAPLLVNACWLAAAWFVAPRFAGDRASQAYVIAASVLVAGVLQLALLLGALRRMGFRFALDWRSAWPSVRLVFKSTVPIALGLAVTQINTLVDSLLAVALAGPPDARIHLAWLGEVAYPLRTGAAAAIYYGERFSQLPVGLLGIALATVLYPLFSRHAARDDHGALGRDLSTGLRLTWFTALPAGVGLLLVAQPLVRLLFVRGAFTVTDADRAAAMIVCYAGAAWAFCALPILVRAFYATGDRRTPLRVGALAVGVDLVLAAALLWPLAERGLALSTAAAAAAQVLVLTAIIARRLAFDWSPLRSTLVKGALATACMAGVVVACQQLYSPPEARFEMARLLTIEICSGAVVYLAVAWLLGMPELSLLTRGRGQSRPVIAAPHQGLTPTARGQAMISRIGRP